MNNTKEVVVSHEVINFRVPAELKAEFDYQCGKDERTISQQLRILMVEYIAKQTDSEPSRESIEKAANNVANGKVHKHVKKPHFTRGK